MSGRFAILQTDVVDSTAIAERLGEVRVSALWTAHDRLARDLLRTFNGREIDKSDGFLLIFDRVADAVGYSVRYHEALASLSEPMLARAGLHVSNVLLRQNSESDISLGAKTLELDGVAKAIAARVMGVARGGQTLMTADARDALGNSPHSILAHGHWRLKGIEEPLQLHEIVVDGTVAAMPEDSAKAYRVSRRNGLWLPLREARQTLPSERDEFVGRRTELGWLHQTFARGARLVSLLGIGGSGKSRLALRYGWIWLGDYDGGVWFCDLAQARTLEGMLFAVAQGLDVPLAGSEPIVQLSNAIAGRGRCLVIFDNFEQVIHHAEETLGRWLSRAPDAQFVVTTREMLGIHGETSLVVPTLPTEEGVTLFMRRSLAARHDFEPTDDDRTAISALVNLLDGLPLAIELAAARVRVMPPRLLLPRMRERFKVLVSTGKHRHDRQATLREVFDWSWEGLSDSERTAIAQLSVFEMGWTMEAAEAVIDFSGLEGSPWAVDVIQTLVQKSLVRRTGDHRFDMLGSVQAYVDEHLRAAGRFPGSGVHALTNARRRHWTYFASLPEEAAVANRCIETENLVVACERAASAEETTSAASILLVAWAALRLRGPFEGAVRLAKSVGSVPNLGLREQGIADWVAGCALYMLGRAGEASRTLEAGLRHAQAAGDGERQAWLLCASAEQLIAQGDMQSAGLALATAKQLSDQVESQSLHCRVENVLGAHAHHRGDIHSARIHYEAALRLAETLGDLRWQGGLLGNLGAMLHSEGQAEKALELYRSALHLAKQTGDRRWEGNTHCNLGLLHHEHGRGEEAVDEFTSALRLARELGHVRLESTVLCNLGIALHANGQLADSLTHYERSLTLARELGDRRSEGQIRGYLGALYASLDRVDEARNCLDRGEALLVEVDDPLSLALLLCSRVKAEYARGALELAQENWRRLKVLAREVAPGDDSELGRELKALASLLPESLSPC